MKSTFGFAAILIVLLVGVQAHAVILHTCESADSIVKRADDEVCDYLVDASQDCFGKLNERLALLAARPANTPAKDLLTEAEPIKESYEAAIPTVKDYLQHMKADVCGDQKVRINVMVDELKIDLKGVTDRISRAKAKLQK